MTTADEKYVALTTFRKNGERKSTPVWIAAVGSDVGFTTGSDSWKLKRLRNDPRCELQASNSRGVVEDGSMVVTGRGREATPEEYAQVKQAIAAKYGITVKLIGLFGKVRGLLGKGTAADTAILITLD